MTFKITSYTIQTLKKTLVSKLICEKDPLFEDKLEEFFKQKLHINFFTNYFEKVNARTILIEYDYIDRDFLEDFAEYYVLCFNGYQRNCLRLHFFDFDFDDIAFKNFLELSNPDEGKKFLDNLYLSYLGFIVVKPLPKAIIGRTCLKIPGVSGRQDFFVTRRYPVNLFGIALEVDTLAFQEQDRVTSACATSALWSTFHKTGQLFHHQLSSPARITRQASKALPLENQFFQNGGLTSRQMAYAIRNVGLEPLMTKLNIYAYLKCQIPVLLGLTIPQQKYSGRHVVTVTGYSLGTAELKPLKDSKFLLRASRIDKIYVHDDQYGAYVDINFEENNTKKTDSNYCLKIWDEKPNGKQIAYPETIMVPLYHKIRITSLCILGAVLKFDKVIDKFFGKDSTEDKVKIKEPIEWDIYLTTLNEFKSSFIESNRQTANYKSVNGTIRQDILLKSLPRFLWRATAYCANDAVLDLLFDATDFKDGTLFQYAVEYDRYFSLVLHGGFRDLDLPKQDLDWSLMEWFKEPSPYEH
jgi:hypothetical protein